MAIEHEKKEMWEYWRDKRGSAVEALECDYPETVKANPMLRVLMVQIVSAQKAIDKIMSEE